MDSASTSPLMVSHAHSKFVHYTVIIISQIFILAFGYGFLGAVAYYEYLAPSDSVCEAMKDYPGEVTMLVTLIATVLSVITATLFTLSVKEALRHRICQPISLIQLSAGIALAQGSHILNHRHMTLTVFTLFVFGVLKLLTAGWTTLLTPTYFMWPVQLNGSEIDITGSAFATLLREEFLANGLIQDNAFEVLDIGGMLSGVAAAGFTFGLPGTFNFNGAKYNISTQGVVPTIEAFSGSDGIPDADGTRLGFSGGNITVNTGVVPGSHSSVPIPQGFSTNYSMWQQGLTANVSCQAIDSSQTQYLWNTNNSYVIYTNPAASSNNSITGLRLWNISANCSTTYEYLTMVDANGNASLSGNGFLPSVVCLGPTDTNQTYTSFTIFTQGFFKYEFLKASVCEVVPLLTTVRADYSNDQISSEVISFAPFQSENAELLLFIAGVARYQSINSQGLTSSTIGDTLYSIYSSTTTERINNNLNDTQVYLELEDYWRGVVEFSATVRLLFLRSGFMATGSFPDNIIPNNLSSPVNGTMFISTIGWTRWTKNSPTYLLATVPLTFITLLTFACALYSLLETWEEHRSRKHKAHFNVSNTIHLIMLCAAESLKLTHFAKHKNGNAIKNNEVVKVQLDEYDFPRLSNSKFVGEGKLEGDA
ncbi:hypothetical protein EV424DRAFT_1349034 [Suillus variegatus]|nr:hypothetical protein EV424DRAFT_1349034 [Suillus variegatus]